MQPDSEFESQREGMRCRRCCVLWVLHTTGGLIGELATVAFAENLALLLRVRAENAAAVREMQERLGRIQSVAGWENFTRKERRAHVRKFNRDEALAAERAAAAPILVPSDPL